MSGTEIRAGHAMCGTELAYGAMSGARIVLSGFVEEEHVTFSKVPYPPTPPPVLRQHHTMTLSSYALCGTEIAYVAIPLRRV
eukprot:10397-Rhodomonas_salina.1